MTWSLIQADCIAAMAELDAESIDAVVTDPPYGIGFMGHAWDQPGDHGPVRANGHPAPFASGRPHEGPHVAGGTAALERHMARSQRRGANPSPTSGAGHERERQALRSVRFGGPTGKDNTTHSERGGAMHAGRYDLSPSANRRFQAWCEAWGSEVLRVLKPGGHIVVFGATRTHHRLTAGLEDAGFEIRDELVWLFGSGFPKSRNLGDGWGTALKPGHEPIVLARKPCAGPASANHAEHGTGGLHIDACRLAVDDRDRETYERNFSGRRGHEGTRPMDEKGATDMRMGGGVTAAKGRWPANVALDEVAAAQLDEQTGELRSGAAPTRRGSDKSRDVYNAYQGQLELTEQWGPSSGGASRFFYVAKTSRRERNAGLDGTPEKAVNWSSGDKSPGSFQSEGTKREQANHHPTVKPIALMRWLVRMVTPDGGTVLDPFTGSGSTGIAAVQEGFDFVGIEREAEYVSIASRRIEHHELPEESAA